MPRFSRPSRELNPASAQAPLLTAESTRPRKPSRVSSRAQKLQGQSPCLPRGVRLVRRPLVTKKSMVGTGELNIHINLLLLHSKHRSRHSGTPAKGACPIHPRSATMALAAWPPDPATREQFLLRKTKPRCAMELRCWQERKPAHPCRTRCSKSRDPFTSRIRPQPLICRSYVQLGRLGRHRLVVRPQGRKIRIAALKTRRRRSMKQLRSNHHVSLRGKPVAHAANVMVNPKCLLEQQQSRMRPTRLRTRHICCHPRSI